MALQTGSKPITYNDVLTGLTKRIYDQKVTEGVYSGDAKISTVIDNVTYTETDDQRASRVLSNKLDAYCIAKSIVDEFQANATVPMSTTVTVTSVSGVTTGPGVSGPGTGSGSGTGSIV